MKKTPANHACGNHVATTQPTCSDNLITRIKTLRFIPTLMTTEMVSATMAGRKTMTRRTKGLDLVNSEPDLHTFLRMQEYPDGSWRAIFQSDDSDEPGSIICPYGKPGDLLWIRETFRDMKKGFDFKVDYPDRQHFRWKPGIHMPKEACRLFLLIKDIRVERLKSITRSDAAAEGVCWPAEPHRPAWIRVDRWPEENFAALWDLINNKGPEEKRMPWSRNPWVWVISFEQASIKFVPELQKALINTKTKK